MVGEEREEETGDGVVAKVGGDVSDFEWAGGVRTVGVGRVRSRKRLGVGAVPFGVLSGDLLRGGIGVNTRGIGGYWRCAARGGGRECAGRGTLLLGYRRFP